MARLEVDAGAFLAGFERGVKDLKRDGEQIVGEVSEVVAGRARSLAPRRTGKLAGSIDAEPGRDAEGPYVDVGTSVPYAVYVEFGTSKARAQPFMRPALAMAATTVRSASGRARRR